MSKFFSAIKTFAKAHKIITFIIVVIAAWGGYTWYANASKTATVTKYVVENAAQGTVISSVSGSGQVQAQTTLDVKPQVSETVTKIYVQVGQHVAAGQALMQLDTTNEAKAVTQAQLNLQSAQLALAKLQQVATTTVLQDQGSVTNSQEGLINASTTLAKDYQSGFDTIATTFIDLQNIMMNMQSFMAGTQVDKVHDNPDAFVDMMPQYEQPVTAPYATALEAQYQGAVTAYAQNLADYHAASRNSDPATLEALFAETQNTVKTVSTAVKAGTDFLNYVVNNYPTNQGLQTLPTITTTYQTNFGNYTNTVNSDLTNITGVINTIASDKQSLVNDQMSLTQASESYNELVAGPNPLDVQSQNISIENAQLSLQTAQQNLAYDTVRAPIAGTVASIPSVVGETVASPAASIVSDGDLAQVTLNEVDAAKVQVGDKANLTFDALPNLALAGVVVELDPVGTVSQGVVNYNVQIDFTQPANTSSSDTVKPGMSVTADIITQVDQNVIALPNASVHSSATGSYVLEPAVAMSSGDVTTSQSGGIILPSGTKMVPVTVGISNDTQTEITAGVNVGDQIITQTVTSVATTGGAAATGGTSALRALTGGAGAGFGGGAGGFGGGGAVRVGGGGAAAGGARVGG
jgi:multidrug efflux pump subunit AcrA (membrane-fusion protein)